MRRNVRLVNLLARVEKLWSVISAVVISIIMVLIIAEIVFRTAGVRFIGAVELVSLLIVAVVFLGLGYTQSQGRHINVTMMVERFSPSLRRWIQAILLLTALVLFALITYSASISAYESWLRGDVAIGIIEFPIWPAKAFIPLGTVPLCLRFLAQFLNLVVPSFKTEAR